MRALSTTAVVIVAVLLAGCSAQATPDTVPSGSAAPEPSASETAEAPVEQFAMPTACLAILPSSRLSAFEAGGVVLLGGPDGLYGDDYLLDPSPEQRAGGITCIWGPPDTELSTVTISVAPLRADARSAIVDDLTVTQGLNESIGEGVTYYWKIGDRDGHPAILNVLTADSWISIIQTLGGTDRYAEAEALAAEVHEIVYD
jgi:hypothetical protein